MKIVVDPFAVPIDESRYGDGAHTWRGDQPRLGACGVDHWYDVPVSFLQQHHTDQFQLHLKAILQMSSMDCTHRLSETMKFDY